MTKSTTYTIGSLLYSIQRIFSYLPICWLLLFLTFLVRAYFQIGHWPSYDNPDPKDLGFDLHYGLVFFGFVLAILSPFIWIPLSFILFFIKGNRKILINVIAYVAGYILMIGLLRFQNDRFFEWLSD